MLDEVEGFNMSNYKGRRRVGVVVDMSWPWGCGGGVGDARVGGGVLKAAMGSDVHGVCQTCW